MYGILIWGCGLFKDFLKKKNCENLWIEWNKKNLFFYFFKVKCVWRYLSGDEIYRNKNIFMFEVDGKRNKVEIIVFFLFKS